MAFSLIQLNEAELAEVAASRVPFAFAERLEDGALPPAFVAARALSLLSAGVAELWSCTFLIVADDAGRIVGSCGFKSAPKAGRVEIGYGVAPGSQGQGAATAAVELLVKTALGAGADEVLAEVSPANHASLRVVQKAGLRPVGARIDEGNEHVLQWLVSRPPLGMHASADPAQPAGATMPIAVAPIALAHVESFRACLDAVARERKYLAQTEALPLERIAAFVRDSVANNAAQYVALQGAVVVGWCDVFPAWADAVRHSGSLGMGVLASHRGRGIGRQLLAATLAHARASGITRVELEVRADNVGAIRLYERLGFVHEGRKRHGMRFDGAYFDSLSMGLVFADA